LLLSEGLKWYMIPIDQQTSGPQFQDHFQNQESESSNTDGRNRDNNCLAPIETTTTTMELDQNDSPPDLSFCVLWSPLHPITAFFPFIGHLGISDSQGRAHDFRGPYYVDTDGSNPIPIMAFGPPTRYLKMDIGDLQGGSHRWDEAIDEADGIYQGRMHNICCDNCHSHVARALNILEHQGRHDWNMVKLAALVFFKGSFVNYKSGILCQFGPFVVLVLIFLLVTGKLFWWMGSVVFAKQWPGFFRNSFWFYSQW